MSAVPSSKPVSRVQQTRRKISYLPTTAAYDRWARVYDTDSNPLQALDDVELHHLLPLFLSLVPRATSTDSRIVDLGCGTGRNTMKLLYQPHTEVVGLDASSNMLAIAKQRCRNALEAAPKDRRASSLKFHVFDMLQSRAAPDDTYHADAVLSTLVIEHIPLPTFFSAVYRMLKEGGLILITNMHPDMGAQSQAGFIDPESGEKIRPESYAHRIEDVLQAARTAGFELIGEILERAVESDMLERIGRRADKWIGVKCWFGMVLKKESIKQ